MIQFNASKFEIHKFIEAHPIGAQVGSSGTNNIVIAALPPRRKVKLSLDPRVSRMVDNAVRAFPIVVLVGAPGTGKGTIIDDLVDRVSENPSHFGFQTHSIANWPNPIRKTPDESTSLSDLVGGLMPDLKGLKWGYGPILDAIANDRWLILDELNRGDLDKILGLLLSWMAGETVELGTLDGKANGRPIQLRWDPTSAKSYVDPALGLGSDLAGGPITFFAGSEFRILGTYNPIDAHRVFGMGQALTRRLRQVPIPAPDDKGMSDLISQIAAELHPTVRNRICELYSAHNRETRSTLGPAVFLEMPKYILAGLRANLVKEDDVTEPFISDLIQEAYLVCVGRFLKNYHPDLRESLSKQPHFQEALGDGGWAWIEQSISDL